MVARDAGKAQGAFAMRAFAVDVRFPVADAERLAAKRHKELAPKLSKGGVFFLPLIDVARKEAEEGISKGEKIQDKEKIAQDGVRAEKSAKEDED